MDIEEFRQKYPEYEKYSDKELSRQLYNTYYQKAMDYDTFDRRFRPLAYKYSGADKTKYTLRAAGEGMAMGMADIAAGGTNVLMNDLAKVTHGQNLKERAGGLWDLFRHTNLMDLKGQKELYTSDNFKRGRADFVQEQDEFKQAHPGLNMAGELGGGLVSGIGGAGKAAGTKILNKLGKWGAAAAAGAGSGAAYGFGSGLTSDPQELDPVQGAKEGAQGAFLGGAFGVGAAAVVNALSRAARAFANRSTRTYKVLNKASGGGLDKSIEEGIPLFDSANKKTLRKIQAAYLADDEASEILSAYGNGRMERHRLNSENLLDKVFGPKGYEQTLADVQEQAKPIYDKLYQKAMDKGQVKVKLDTRGQRYLRVLRRNQDVAPELEKLPDNDMRVLDLLKRTMDDRIGYMDKNGISAGYKELVASRAKLVNQIDKQNKYYKLARNVFERQKRFEEGALRGGKIFENPASDVAEKTARMGRPGPEPDWQAMREKARALKTPGAAEKRLADIDMQEQVYQSMASAERRGFAAGAARKLRQLAESSNADYENVAKKLFSQNRLRKLKAAGIDVSGIEEAAAREIKTAGNMKNILRGSQTAEREVDVGRMILHPIKALRRKTADSINWLLGVDQKELARMVTDPGYAALVRMKAGGLPKAAYTDISGAGGAFAHIAGPLTRREKDAMRRGVQEHLMQNVRGSSVHNQALGRDIHFSRPGIDKAINSSQDLEKLKMTQYAAEIAKRGRPYQASRRRGLNVYDYLMTPVNIDGKRTSAATTLRNGYFYNVNPMDYAIKKKPQDLVVPLTKQGPLEAQNPGRLSQKPTGGIAKGIHSIENKAGKVKGNKPVKPFDMRDFLILLSRPYTLGTAAAISGQNTLADKSGLAFAQALNDILDYPYTRARQTQKREDK